MVAAQAPALVDPTAEVAALKHDFKAFSSHTTSLLTSLQVLLSYPETCLLLP